MPVLAQYDRIKNLRPRKNIQTAMNHEINMFACSQKEQNGLDKAVEECKYRMSRYGVTPNVRSHATTTPTPPISVAHTRACVCAQMLIIPPQLSLYMALAPESKLTCAAAAQSPLGGILALTGATMRSPTSASQVQGGRTGGRGALRGGRRGLREPLVQGLWRLHLGALRSE